MRAESVFTGFPAEGLQFLSELQANNDREWFQSNKERYREFVLQPAQDFVIALGGRLRGISPGIQFDPQTSGSGSIMRIYRDVRFSKDKTPYNTNVRLLFWEGTQKKMENPSFFIRLDPAGGDIYAGMYQFPKPFLQAYREAVDDEGLGKALLGALDEVKNAGGYVIGGEQYKRVPAGYDPDHPRQELLRYKGIYSEAPKLDPDLLMKPELVGVCFRHCQNMAPPHRWLVKIAVQASG